MKKTQILFNLFFSFTSVEIFSDCLIELEKKEIKEMSKQSVINQTVVRRIFPEKTSIYKNLHGFQLVRHKYSQFNIFEEDDLIFKVNNCRYYTYSGVEINRSDYNCKYDNCLNIFSYLLDFSDYRINRVVNEVYLVRGNKVIKYYGPIFLFKEIRLLNETLNINKDRLIGRWSNLVNEEIFIYTSGYLLVIVFIIPNSKSFKIISGRLENIKNDFVLKDYDDEALLKFNFYQKKIIFEPNVNIDFYKKSIELEFSKK